MKSERDENRVTPIAAFLFGVSWGFLYIVECYRDMNNNFRSHYGADLANQGVSDPLLWFSLSGIFFGCISYAIFIGLQDTKFAPRPIVVRIAGFTTFIISCLLSIFYLLQSGYA
jgi:hypothetical protein